MRRLDRCAMKKYFTKNILWVLSSFQNLTPRHVPDTGMQTVFGTMASSVSSVVVLTRNTAVERKLNLTAAHRRKFPIQDICQLSEFRNVFTDTYIMSFLYILYFIRIAVIDLLIRCVVGKWYVGKKPQDIKTVSTLLVVFREFTDYRRSHYFVVSTVKPLKQAICSRTDTPYDPCLCIYVCIILKYLRLYIFQYTSYCGACRRWSGFGDHDTDYNLLLLPVLYSVQTAQAPKHR